MKLRHLLRKIIREQNLTSQSPSQPFFDVFGCHAMLTPKKRLLTSEQHSFPLFDQSQLLFHFREPSRAPITAFVPFSRTFARQICHFKLVQSEIMFYLPITWWDNRRQRRLVKRCQTLRGDLQITAETSQAYATTYKDFPQHDLTTQLYLKLLLNT